MISWSDDMISEARLDLGLAKSSIVGNEPKRPMEVRNVIKKSKAIGPTTIIQISRTKREGPPFFDWGFEGERFLSAIGKLKIQIEFNNGFLFYKKAHQAYCFY